MSQAPRAQIGVGVRVAVVDVGEPLDQSLEVTHAVPVAVGEGTDEDLVAHRAVPPVGLV
jgi:hypothetical protein